MFTGTDAPSSNIPTFTRIPPDLLGVEGECLHDKTDVCHNALLHNITNTVIARLCFGQTAQVLMSEMTSLRISLLCPLERPAFLHSRDQLVQAGVLSKEGAYTQDYNNNYTYI